MTLFWALYVALVIFVTAVILVAVMSIPEEKE